jgi:hypothetical protein
LKKINPAIRQKAIHHLVLAFKTIFKLFHYGKSDKQYLINAQDLSQTSWASGADCFAQVLKIGWCKLDE